VLSPLGTVDVQPDGHSVELKANDGARVAIDVVRALDHEGLEPVALALHPSVNNTGQFLYTSNSTSDNISGFTLGTTSGAMSSPISVLAPSAPSGMTVH